MGLNFAYFVVDSTTFADSATFVDSEAFVVAVVVLILQQVVVELFVVVVVFVVEAVFMVDLFAVVQVALKQEAEYSFAVEASTLGLDQDFVNSNFEDFEVRLKGLDCLIRPDC